MATGASALSGTIKDADGEPVPKAQVSARRDGSSDPETTTTAGEKGEYRIEGLVQGKRYTLTVETPDGQKETRTVTLRRREQTEDISLPGGGPDMADTTPTPDRDTTPSGTQPTDTTPTGTGGDAGEPAPTGGGTGTATEPSPGAGTTTTGGGNGNGAATITEDAFQDLIDRVEEPGFAPEPPVNINEANELARLFVISMYQLARIPEAINRLFTTRGANYQAGDLTLERMDQLSPNVQQKMQEVIRSRTEQFDTEEDLLREIRHAFNLGTGAVPSVNAEFGPLYRNLVTLAADDRSGVDPDKVESEDPAEAAAIYNFLRDLKRSILRLTQNASVYGTLGTKRLVDKWSKIMLGSVEILDEVGRNHVVSADSDDKAPWSLLAGLTDTPRGTVKAYVVNARNGGALLRLAIGIYDAVQDTTANRDGAAAGDGLGSGGIDDEAREFLRRLFFSKGNAVLKPPLDTKVGETLVGDELSKHARLARDYVGPLWA